MLSLIRVAFSSAILVSKVSSESIGLFPTNLTAVEESEEEDLIDIAGVEKTSVTISFGLWTFYKLQIIKPNIK